ncbi:uncharacterized protein [Mytilus edulis]|uniref:Uncharacterized protein n=3 Tax=Mytilus TaxID=6548 RepID=A0A8B6E4I2_MYTGA|nr:unnamed protein product [Mytilus edulis]VDI28794.1 Hypothetical predicted protein [Mytilus galloprovincialis]
MSSEESDISDDEIQATSSRSSSMKRLRLTADELVRHLEDDDSDIDQTTRVDSDDESDSRHQIDARDISVSPVPAEIRTPIAISNRTEQRTPISNRNSRTPNNTSYSRANTSTPLHQSSQLQDENTTTPSVHSMSTRDLLIKIYERQNEILIRLKERETVGVSQKVDQTVIVPPAVKNAVRQGFKNGKDKGLTWIFDDGKRVCDAVNDGMTSHIKNFMKGWNPTYDNPTVLNHALNRYFLTKKQENTAIHKDKLETEKRKRASYERKKEKAKRRITALEKMEISAAKKANIRACLENKYMSSDEECADGFITHQPSWQSKRFAEYKRKLDSKFLDICSTKSRRLLSKRTIGSVSEKENPDIKDETLLWVIKEN